MSAKKRLTQIGAAKIEISVLVWPDAEDGVQCRPNSRRLVDTVRLFEAVSRHRRGTNTLVTNVNPR